MLGEGPSYYYFNDAITGAWIRPSVIRLTAVMKRKSTSALDGAAAKTLKGQLTQSLERSPMRTSTSNRMKISETWYKGAGLAK